MVDATDATEAARLHQALVDDLKGIGCFQSPDVEAAFRAVPRHHFLPGLALNRVYRDEAIPTKLVDGRPISSSSQPAIMALMLEQLQLRPGHRVLEIGAGTGYNAALMAQIVGETGSVVTIDIDQVIVDEARDHLAAAGYDLVHAICADGGLGFPEGAPFDRVILTVGAWDIAPAWWDQLTADGRLVLPLWVRGAQKSVAFERVRDHWTSRSVCACGFMRLRGAFAGPEAYLPLGTDSKHSISVEDRTGIDGEAVAALLRGSSRQVATTTTVTPREAWEGLSLWLALREPSYCTLASEVDEQEAKDGLPYLYRFSDKSRATDGLLGPASACFLVADRRDGDAPERGASIRLAVRHFGDDDGRAQRLIKQIADWEEAGRPTDTTLSIAAYPKDGPDAPPSDAITVEKRWNRLAFRWA